MGLSNILPTGGYQGAVPAEGATPAKSPDFGQRLSNYFESKYPIASGLAQAVFGDNQVPAIGRLLPKAAAPLAAMPQAGQQDASMLAMNAQPNQGGDGLEVLRKLFAA